MLEIGGLIGQMAGALRDLNVDEDAIAKVVGKLQAVADDVERSGFHDVALPGSAFGGSPRGHQVAAHHSAAYHVVAETIEGVVKDLQDFGAGVTRAVGLVTQADGVSAADLKAQAAAVEVLTYEAQHRDGDRRHDQARSTLPFIPDVGDPEPFSRVGSVDGAVD